MYPSGMPVSRKPPERMNREARQSPAGILAELKQAGILSKLPEFVPLHTSARNSSDLDCPGAQDQHATSNESQRWNWDTSGVDREPEAGRRAPRAVRVHFVWDVPNADTNPGSHRPDTGSTRRPSRMFTVLESEKTTLTVFRALRTLSGIGIGLGIIRLISGSASILLLTAICMAAGLFTMCITMEKLVAKRVEKEQDVMRGESRTVRRHLHWEYWTHPVTMVPLIGIATIVGANHGKMDRPRACNDTDSSIEPDSGMEPHEHLTTQPIRPTSHWCTTREDRMGRT